MFSQSAAFFKARSKVHSLNSRLPNKRLNIINSVRCFTIAHCTEGENKKLIFKKIEIAILDEMPIGTIRQQIATSQTNGSIEKSY